MKLIPVVAQDARTNAVLMLAYADAGALRRARRTGFMHYWSRSRRAYWKKGETSGNTQRLVGLHYDCDRDAILARVEQKGPACHRGTPTCFGDGFPDLLDLLERTIDDRRRRPKEGSYTNRLLADPALLRDKLIEEACELAMASRGRKRAAVVAEAADLLYHALVLLAAADVSLADVKRELARRHRR
ncbi:MAG: bifunctional phosphoribosyl-AMP cyclohydrolase/phosphoribosyl-ATP diphosphatase HisIE [Planctomycetes bacterium]|nr:bifunctional phosphoribosyl-AMP cyclohydrolase/phosphoribosyl-ATP diphosphatase HisIE [Planctomycetota bacterium]